MNFLLFHLQRLFLLPIRLFRFLAEAFNSLWGVSGKSRALLLGLPAVIFGVAGIAFLCWANYGIADSLENRYKADVKKSAEEKNRLVNELRREIRMLQATQKGTAAEMQTEVDELIPENDPRRVELKEWRDREEVYLEKLIDLNPEEAEYLFQLSIVSFEKEDRNRGLALMNLIAPLDEPGYVKAHLWLANFHISMRGKTRQEAIRNVALAMNHVDQCLKREQDNLRAKQIKAGLLYAQREFDEAYVIFSDLFQSDAQYYKSLVEINKRLKKEERNPAILDKAISSFRDELRSENLDEAKYLGFWNQLVSCYREKKDFSTAEQSLLEEIERQSNLSENSGKRVWAERLLASIYLGSIAEIDRNSPEATAQRLEILRKAYRLDSTNSLVMRELTRVGTSRDSTIAQEARNIYDAANQPDAPAIVLNELGSYSLANSNYESALRYFEMARKKEPRNPEILNNLAYTYTVIDPPNPKRGLKLIDEALRYIAKKKSNQQYFSFFHDTRGQTLMQLGRMTEAAAEFEFALQDRPENRGILEAIIKCYTESELDASAYVERLRQLDESEAVSDSSQSPQTPGQ